MGVCITHSVAGLMVDNRGSGVTTGALKLPMDVGGEDSGALTVVLSDTGGTGSGVLAVVVLKYVCGKGSESLEMTTDIRAPSTKVRGKIISPMQRSLCQ